MYTIHCYVKANKIKTVSRLLEKDSTLLDSLDGWPTGNTPLMTAIKHNRLKIVEFLASSGANPYLKKLIHWDEIVLNSFEYAIKHSKLECLRILLENGYVPTLGTFHPVELAMHFNADEDVIDFLREAIKELDDDLFEELEEYDLLNGTD